MAKMHMNWQYEAHAVTSDNSLYVYLKEHQVLLEAVKYTDVNSRF